MYGIERYARRLLLREREHYDTRSQRFWDGLVKSREFALLAEELTVASLMRGSLTADDRVEALGLSSIKAVYWWLRLSPEELAVQMLANWSRSVRARHLSAFGANYTHQLEMSLEVGDERQIALDTFLAVFAAGVLSAEELASANQLAQRGAFGRHSAYVLSVTRHE